MYENVDNPFFFSDVRNVELSYFLKTCPCEDAQQNKALVVPFLLQRKPFDDSVGRWALFLLKKGRTENAPDVVHVIRDTGRPRIVGVVLCRVNGAYLVRRIRFNEPIVNGMAQDGLDCRKCLVIDGLWGKCLWVWIFCLSTFKAFDDLEDRKILKFLGNTGRAFKKGVLCLLYTSPSPRDCS